MPTDKGSIFSNTTGEFLIYSAVNGSKYQGLKAAGNIEAIGINGGAPDWLMWDFAASAVVPDWARRQKDQDQVQNDQDDFARRDLILQELKTLYQSVIPADRDRQIDLMNELSRLGTVHRN